MTPRAAGYRRHSALARENVISTEAVSVIIPTFRRPDALTATLEALEAVDYPDDLLEVIVVDDGSDAATEEVANGFAEAGLRVRYISQSRQGAATARNAGARAATGALLIFLDDDMLVEPTHISDHLATRARFGDCLVNGHWEFTPDTIAMLQESPFGRFRIALERWIKNRIAKTPLDGGCVAPAEVTACNLSISRELFWKLGGFDEQFPFAGYEDQEFSYRAAGEGHQFVYNPEIRLLHNDRRVTLRQFCKRQSQGAMTSVFIAAKHPGEYAQRPLITENAPASRGDSARLVLKKALKRVLSARPALAAEHAVIDLWERLRPQSAVLQRAYWTMCGLYIFRGVRSGLETVEVPRQASAGGAGRDRPD